MHPVALELVVIHPLAVVGDDQAAVAAVAPEIELDEDVCGVGVVGVLDELQHGDVGIRDELLSKDELQPCGRLEAQIPLRHRTRCLGAWAEVLAVTAVILAGSLIVAIIRRLASLASGD